MRKSALVAAAIIACCVISGCDKADSELDKKINEAVGKKTGPDLADLKSQIQKLNERVGALEAPNGFVSIENCELQHFSREAATNVVAVQFACGQRFIETVLPTAIEAVPIFSDEINQKAQIAYGRSAFMQPAQITAKIYNPISGWTIVGADVELVGKTGAENRRYRLTLKQPIRPYSVVQAWADTAEDMDPKDFWKTRQWHLASILVVPGA